MTFAFDPDPILHQLKPFQRRTVEYVFRRLYVDPHPTHRFLVADEVGLGKTHVARGVIAKAIQHLENDIERIDVLYVCSNSEIARQNISRLNVLDQAEFSHASRITLLPVTIHGVKNNRVNFVSLTPGTSLDMTSGQGVALERAVLFHMLQGEWQFDGSGPYKAFRGRSHLENFRRLVDEFHAHHVIDHELKAKFLEDVGMHDVREALLGALTLKERFERVIDDNQNAMPWQDEDDASWKRRRDLIHDLRRVLAKSCIDALEPDLIILDEFQRFKDLLDKETEAGGLADVLFTYQDEYATAKVLLLSATPYKMYSHAHEESESHYRDFLDTFGFLAGSEQRNELEQRLATYRRSLYSLDRVTPDALADQRRDLESRLRRVMSRTERLATSSDRNGMLTTAAINPVVTASDVQAYLAISDVARHLDVHDPLEYWRSAPYLLNFMNDYKIKREYDAAVERGDPTLLALAEKHRSHLLPLVDLKRYAEIDPQNAKLRWLVSEVKDSGAWQLLWVPPSLPYYRPAGAFARVGNRAFTKWLVFSAWHVVPRAVSTLVTYEVERSIFQQADAVPINTPDARQRRSPLLRFAKSGERPANMAVLAWLYPSDVLSDLGDPLRIPVESTSPPNLSDVLRRIQSEIEASMRSLPGYGRGGTLPDERWYWLAPLLLDAQGDRDRTLSWLSDRTANAWSGNDADANFHEHVAFARAAIDNVESMHLGRPPDDLVKVLSLLALSGPGNVSRRAFRRFVPALRNSPILRTAAAKSAWAFRAYFNAPEPTALIRGAEQHEGPYWLQILHYAADGNIQSVIDEYVQMLWEGQGLGQKTDVEALDVLVEKIDEALTLRTVTLRVDTLSAAEGEKSVGMRGSYALPYGDIQDEPGQQATRADQVRAAFNSPFLPHVLVSTSVGQEGLDFHAYCHSVVHWNLPSNPVDLEQREGRVHRYKNHAVRKNLAHQLSIKLHPDRDPWEELFARAVDALPENSSGVTPYWVYEGPHRIERCVPALPLSREIGRLADLRKSLAIYRMVFGQVRQDDLLDYLQSLGDVPEDVANALRIDLEPPRS